MGWLRDYVDQSEKIARLTSEMDALTDVANELEARLTREIDSNRSREDALTAKIVELVGGGHIPRRTDLADELVKPELLKASLSERYSEAVTEERAFEDEVDQVTIGFIENARTRGIEYTVEDVDVLKSRIRANPAEYLEN